MTDAGVVMSTLVDGPFEVVATTMEIDEELFGRVRVDLNAPNGSPALFNVLRVSAVAASQLEAALWEDLRRFSIDSPKAQL